MPKFSESGLSSDIPDSEVESSVVHFLDIEANSGNRGNSLIKFHLIEDGGLAGTIKSKHKDLGFHVGEGVEDFEDVLTHF